MSRSGRILMVGGLALALWGMSYGLYYALFVEHQTLDSIGGSLAMSFAHAADGRLQDSQVTLDAYASAQHDYVRSVDVHSHWIGLAMLLIVFGAVFDRVNFTERAKVTLAVALITGSAIFPVGVLMQTMNGDLIARAIAAAGAALVTVALLIVAIGIARRPAAEVKR